MDKVNKEVKKLDFSLKALDGEKGIIKAIASSNNADRTNDIIPERTLLKAIQNAKDEGIEKIPMKYMHKEDKIIGSFLVDKMEVINGNLEVVGKINLNTSLGKDVYALIKEGDMNSLSVGIYIYDAENKDNKRIINDMFIFEISVVDIPANKDAIIKDVKKITFDEVKNKVNTVRDVEKTLKEVGISGEASKHIISVLKTDVENKIKEKEYKKIMSEISSFANNIKI